MTGDTFDAFMSGVIGICAIMAIVNLLLVKRRGLSGYLLSSAFIAMGATVYAYKVAAPMLWIEFGGGVVVILLVGDVFLRAGNTNGGRSQKP